MIGIYEREGILLNLDLFFLRQDKPLSSGETISGLRKLSLFSQEDLSRLSGISKTNISDYENDRLAAFAPASAAYLRPVGKVTKRAAMRLAPALGVHPGDILFPKDISFDNEGIQNKRNKLLEKKVYFASIS